MAEIKQNTMELQKVTFKDILELDVQLNGFANAQVSVKGILGEKLNIKTKYWLGRLNDQIQKEKKSFSDLRDELIKKHGSETENGFEIKQMIDEKPNPALAAFQEELADLLGVEVEISFPQLDLDAFDFETENDYSYLLKFVIK